MISCCKAGGSTNLSRNVEVTHQPHYMKANNKQDNEQEGPGGMTASKPELTQLFPAAGNESNILLYQSLHTSRDASKLF